MENFWKRAILQTLLSAVFSAVFCLIVLALFAVFVRAYAPGDITITVFNQVLKAVSAFLFPLIIVRGERALFQGAASGALCVLLTMLLFGTIGGFHLNALFLIELLLGGIFGALGAVSGKKLRKE